MCKKGLYIEGHIRVWMRFALSALACLIFSTSAWAVDYIITDLGTLGGTTSYARGINNNGQVVGAVGTADGLEHAFLYSNGSMIDLGTLGGTYSYAFSINNNGQVVGSARTDEDQDHAFLYGNGSMIDLGTLGGMYSYARDINNNGQVVGYDILGEYGEMRAFLYSNGSMIDLFPGSGGGAVGINNNGQVLGSAYGSTVIYSNGNLDYLDFGGPGDAFGINDNGKVVGSHESPPGGWAWHAFLYSNGSTIDLGTLGGMNSTAFSINNNDQVVGWSYTAVDPDRHAFLFSNGSMMDLNSLIPANSGWTLFEVAYDINDRGQIVGFGFFNGVYHAFLLTPAYAEQWIGSLIETINSLDLKQGITTSLEAELHAALNAAHANEKTTACNLMDAFINTVSAQSAKKITVDQANQLMAAAWQIKAALPCH